MTDKTEQKIIDSALKIFAEKGYTGATTRVIASDAGFTEMTLYRKFKTKENLFKAVLNRSNQKMMEDFGLIFMDKKFSNSREFLEILIRNLVKLGQNNFEFIKITMNESNRISGNFIEEFVDHISIYVEKNVQNKEMDYRIFVFNILSFIYLLLLNYGHSFKDQEEAIDKFINNIFVCP
ncbi:MAG TPA: TetR/AcrR family transcriptional regulator [Methanobacterium sp.]|nr:TetR/AcrR family transcriptional regulator [Methanobacterium sp.]